MTGDYYENDCPICGQTNRSQTTGHIERCERCGELFLTPPPEPEPDNDDEPDEGDICTEDHANFYQYGKLWLFVDPDSWTTSDELNEQIRERMNADQYWPNVWFISDHGNAHLMNVWEKG